MQLNEILKSEAMVVFQIKPCDLHSFLQDIAPQLVNKKSEKPEENYLTRKEVIATLGIDSSTLWNWEKTGYIKSFPFGGRKRYREHDVEMIRTGRKGGCGGK